MKKKKKKGKPREQMYFLENTLQEKTFNYYIKEMEEKTKSFKLKSALDVEFYLFQKMLEKSNIIDMVFNLAYFYDTNFTGNKDFMHTPTIDKIIQSFTRYPILLATQKNQYGAEEILGATIIKFENNVSILDNPYFPTKNENVLSITGVLTKQSAFDLKGNKIKGIGKELYKSAIKGAYELNKNKTIRLICEIDCRNVNSLNSISNAVRELQQENIPIQLYISGYYEIYDKNKNLTEAPTFILEIDLNGERNIKNTLTKFSYLQCDSESLFQDLVEVIKGNTEEERKYFNIHDKHIVIFHSIKSINALNVELEVGRTAEGNDRIPLSKPVEMEYVIGDIQ